MSKRLHLAAGLFGAAAMGLTSSPTIADAAAKPGSDCFLTTQWQDWRSPSPSVIYIRVNVSDVYRLDLSAPAHALQYPGVHLFHEVRGSPWICSPLDLQLYVVDNHRHGMREPLFVKSITRLTPDEAKAIPPKFRP